MGLKLAALLLLLGVLLAPAQAQNCTRCADGMECCGGDHCCPYDTPGEYMCCDSTESCCVGECCITQTTYCCKKTAMSPDRCCPRWTICCQAGVEDGCCTPLGMPWKPWMGMEAPSERYLRLVDRNDDPNAIPVYTLFMEVDTVYSTTIDALTGEIISNKIVPFNNWGEMTRVFMFDEVRELFYYLETNFTVVPGPQGRQIKLYTIDPTSGSVASAAVSGGAYNFVSGYFYHHDLDVIFFATTLVSGADEQTVGYQWFSLNVTTARATLLSTMAATTDYAGWLHAVSADGSTSFRLGFDNLDEQSDPGLGWTDITQTNATTKWMTDVPLPANHEFYSSCYPARNGSGTTSPYFYSLAVRDAVLSSGFDLVSWQLGATQASVVATLGVDTSPRYFGPVAETMSNDQQVYAAALFVDGVLPVMDRWALVFVALPSGNVTQVPVSQLIGDTVSITGLGIPLGSQRRIRQRVMELEL